MQTKLEALCFLLLCCLTCVKFLKIQKTEVSLDAQSNLCGNGDCDNYSYFHTSKSLVGFQ